MSALLESFAGGVCFGFGAVFAIIVCALTIRRNDKVGHAETKAHFKAVEERLSRQAEAVCHIAQMMAKEKSK